MAQAVAYYRVGPDVWALHTRAELVAMVDSYLEQVGFSQRARRQVDLKRLWRKIQFARSASCAHFTIESTLTGDRRALSFEGLTLAEYEAADD